MNKSQFATYIRLKIVVIVCLLPIVPLAQTTTQKLQKAFQQFENDSQLKHAISSLYVIDAATGKVVFDKNSQVGLAGASTQKIITASTAFELLGKEFKYKTDMGYKGMIKGDTLVGDLFLLGTGDPTLGSWRYESTRISKVTFEWLKTLNDSGIKIVRGEINYGSNRFSVKTIPDGWIWQDIGNYYGAAPAELNWRENQFDIKLRSGDMIGSNVEIVYPAGNFINELKAAAKGTGDNAYVYLPNGDDPIIAGTIPVGESSFSISAANLNPAKRMSDDLEQEFISNGIIFLPSLQYPGIVTEKFQPLATHLSPSLDSIVYWFLKKSINLYGEALVKTFAYEKNGFGSTNEGVNIVKDFWKQKGIDEDELNIYDGSGLSPLNRLTTHAQVEVLKFAKTRDWFPYFYDALPEYNGMKMKSGTISDVKGFCGYQKASDGKEYIFSFLVNNYNGRTSGVVEKMYKVLDNLK